MEDLSVFVPNVHFEQIPIKNLVSNQEYQRTLSQVHIARAAANFDVYQVNPVKVSRRDGINYVFNGRHTVEIIASVSGSRDTPVWCMIYDDLIYEHEADIFANQMKFVKRLQPYEIFKANVEAGNDVQLIIQGLVESYGLKIGSKRTPGIICAVTTLENIYLTYGYKDIQLSSDMRDTPSRLRQQALTAIRSNPEFYRLILAGPNNRFLTRLTKDTYTFLSDEYVPMADREALFPMELRPFEKESAIQYLLHGSISVMQLWLENGCKETVGEIDQVLSKLNRSVVRIFWFPSESL